MARKFGIIGILYVFKFPSIDGIPKYMDVPNYKTDEINFEI